MQLSQHLKQSGMHSRKSKMILVSSLYRYEEEIHSSLQLYGHGLHIKLVQLKARVPVGPLFSVLGRWRALRTTTVRVLVVDW